MSRSVKIPFSYRYFEFRICNGAYDRLEYVVDGHALDLALALAVALAVVVAVAVAVIVEDLCQALVELSTKTAPSLRPGNCIIR